jgi:predicted XRE-type DNA-binding protein
MAKVTKSGGNVFEDLGFDAAEAENLKLRAQLMRELEMLIHDV